MTARRARPRSIDEFLAEAIAAALRSDWLDALPPQVAQLT
jgi:hypothetical protein